MLCDSKPNASTVYGHGRSDLKTNHIVQKFDAPMTIRDSHGGL